MKVTECLALLSLCVFTCVNCTMQPKEESMAEMIERGLQTAAEQSVMLVNQLESQDSLLPRTFEDGQLKTAKYHSWISGFFPGVL